MPKDLERAFWRILLAAMAAMAVLVTVQDALHAESAAAGRDPIAAAACHADHDRGLR